MCDSTATVAPRQRSKSRRVSYLEYNGKISETQGNGEEDRTSVRYELVACKCKCRFCSECAERLGLVLRRRLKAVLADCYADVQMWTLTVDPSLFSNAEEAYRYIRERGSVSAWVKELKRRGYLNSGRYFCVVEFHQSGWIHFHLLLDTHFVPFSEACEVWNRNRPADLAPPPGHVVVERRRIEAPIGAVAMRPDGSWCNSLEEYHESEGYVEVKYRPGFGGCRFSKGDFQSKEHAANYATKYLIKEPRDGWPDWVLDFQGQIHRFQTSHQFWPDGVAQLKADEPKKETGKEPCAQDCFCDKCRGDVEVKTCRTIRERVEECGRDQAALIEITETKLASGEVEVVHKWVGVSLLPYQMALEALNRDPEITGLRCPIDAHELKYLRGGSCLEDYAVTPTPQQERDLQQFFEGW